VERVDRELVAVGEADEPRRDGGDRLFAERHAGGAQRVAVLRLAPPQRADPRVRSRAFTRHGITFLPLTRAGAANGMHAFKVLYPADERVPTPTVHDGHDWIYVLSGRLRLVLGEEVFVLEPGEAAEFSCRVPHALGAVDGPAEALAIFGPHGERSHTR
jgi:quercetin dioxygenase-like cupin family protein